MQFDVCNLTQSAFLLQKNVNIITPPQACFTFMSLDFAI